VVKKLNHVFIDTENTSGLSPTQLQNHLNGVRLSKKIAVVSNNTPLNLKEKWIDSPFSLICAGSDKNAADYRLKDEIMRQITVDEKTGHAPADIYIAVTGDTDYCDLIAILRRLGHEVFVIGWGEVHNKLKELATESVNLLKQNLEVDS
jgi:uncharacterized LabA/DUF88 family protein